MNGKKWITAALVGGLAVFILYSWRLGQPIFDERLNEDQFLSELSIAPIEEALTFATLRSGRALLVIAANRNGIAVIELESDAGTAFTDGIEAYQALGVHKLKTIAAEKETRTKHYAWEELGVPVNENYPHIAAGTNYRAHAQEVGHIGEPFVFPKLSRVTAWNADVNSAARLDYEVELCSVPLTRHTPSSAAKLAYILCGDYTDRWTLIRDIEIGAPMGPTGFPSAKGGVTRLPVGPLLVIPKAENFYQKVQLQLYVNQDLRQRSSASEMIWSPETILDKALANCRVSYSVGTGQTAVTPSCDEIAAGTLILTGTPAGVMFNIATLWNPLSYLRVGDTVTSSATYLGMMRNTIK
jgi:2-keto-4-pentenoate hydratase/2-oxohepta-3-ene-1,7-dioic acid hydratase in catechol pathway